MAALADTVTARPSGLWLSLSPPHNTFARGELASLICSLPEGQRATRFYFYEKRGGVPVMYGQQVENILEVSTKYLETNKTFLCAYLGGKSSGGLFLSSLSNEVVLSITDLPRAPVFSVSPKKDVYTRGESVELKCSSSETRHVSRTQFFRDQLDLHSVKPSSPSSLNNVTHTLRLVIQDGGDYSCRYHIVESGREIASRESNSIRISLTDRLRPPFFSVSPKLDIYSSGEIVNLTCSAPGNLLMSMVLFWKDRRLLYVYRSPSPLASFTYTRHLSPQDSGDHFCTYRAAESSWNISSPESRRVRISVMVHMLLIFSSPLLKSKWGIHEPTTLC